MEYFERRAFGKHRDASRLFLYKVTRDLLHWTGDTGAFLHTVMKPLTLFGVPPEEYYPYAVPDDDKEPPAFCYAFAQSYQAITYYRFDPPGTPRDALVHTYRVPMRRPLQAPPPVAWSQHTYGWRRPSLRCAGRQKPPVDRDHALADGAPSFSTSCMISSRSGRFGALYVRR